MATTEALRTVDAYHQAWTTKQFDKAIAYLAPALRVEVPINDYPTTESFADALVRFGSQVESVKVLSKLGDEYEAMVLYDMDVKGLGAMRVVEHFTVADGKIVCLRQIHDTAALRGGDVDQGASEPEAAGTASGDGYTTEIFIDAPRHRVFEALTTLDGLTGWWASRATGFGSPGATFELGFNGLDETITWRVDAAIAPSSVTWTCLRHTGLPDWDGSKLVFELRKHRTDSTDLAFRHIGLVRELDCYEQCRAGWDHFLPSLRSYVERGHGSPFAGQRH